MENILCIRTVLGREKKHCKTYYVLEKSLAVVRTCGDAWNWESVERAHMETVGSLVCSSYSGRGEREAEKLQESTSNKSVIY